MILIRGLKNDVINLSTPKFCCRKNNYTVLRCDPLCIIYNIVMCTSTLICNKNLWTTKYNGTVSRYCFITPVMMLYMMLIIRIIVLYGYWSYNYIMSLKSLFNTNYKYTPHWIIYKCPWSNYNSISLLFRIAISTLHYLLYGILINYKL